MHAQHHCRQQHLPAQRVRQLVMHGVVHAAFAMPRLPRGDLATPGFIECAGHGERQLVMVQPLDLHPETRVVGDDDAEVAYLRDVHARIIHLVDDAVADGEPEPRGFQCAAHHLLVAAAPGRRPPRRARCFGHEGFGFGVIHGPAPAFLFLSWGIVTSSVKSSSTVEVPAAGVSGVILKTMNDREGGSMREYIRHPSSIPLEVKIVDQHASLQQDVLNNVSVGGLSFCSREAVNTGARIVIRIPIIKESVEVTGRVVWCHRKGQWYDVGISFTDQQEAFRTRMVEQICHIERYKDEVRRDDRREISSEEAAAEWSKKYADSFPMLDE